MKGYFLKEMAFFSLLQLFIEQNDYIYVTHCHIDMVHITIIYIFDVNPQL